MAIRTGTSDPTSRPRLNPLFVEWLMGWPQGWTDLDLRSSEMGWCPCAQHTHSSRFALVCWEERMRNRLAALGWEVGEMDAKTCPHCGVEQAPVDHIERCGEAMERRIRWKPPCPFCGAENPSTDHVLPCLAAAERAARQMLRQGNRMFTDWLIACRNPEGATTQASMFGARVAGGEM